MPKPKSNAKLAPQFLEMPAQKMAVVRTIGDPNVVGQTEVGALYGAVYTHKFARKKQDPALDFKVGALRARWPDAATVPKEQWTGIWGLPIPQDTTELPKKVPDVEVDVEVWQYGTVAQILHLGPYDTEQATILRLHEFIAEQGYEITGEHEEEYLTRPTAKVQKTLIRCPVRKR